MVDAPANPLGGAEVPHVDDVEQADEEQVDYNSDGSY